MGRGAASPRARGALVAKLLLLACLAPSQCAIQGLQEEHPLEKKMTMLQDKVNEIEEAGITNQNDILTLYSLYGELAMTVQTLEYEKPSGGRRFATGKNAYEQAIKLLEQIVPYTGPEGEVNLIVLYQNLGALLLGSGDAEGALVPLAKALKVNWNYPSIHFNQGKAYDNLGDIVNATLSYRESVVTSWAGASKDPTLNTIAKAYASLPPGNVTAEDVALMESLLPDGDVWPGRVAGGGALIPGGGGGGSLAGAPPPSPQMDDIIQSMWSSIPPMGLAGVRHKGPARRPPPRAPAKEVTGAGGGEPDLETVQRLPKRIRRYDNQDLVYLHYALFRYFDRNKSYERAWHHLARGNELQKSLFDEWGLTYSRVREEALIGQLKQIFTGQDTADPGAFGFKSNAPIFVMGMPRSGSTLVESILDAHSEVRGRGEDTAFAPLVGDLLSALAQPAALQGPRVEAVGRSYVEQMTRGSSEPRFVDKMLRNLWHVGYIQVMVPNSCLIETVRNELDVAFSCFATPFEGRGLPWAWDMEDIAHQLNMTQAVSNIWENAYPGVVMQVHYDDMTEDPEGTARAIADHCGLEWEDALMKFAENKRSVATASNRQIRKGIYKREGHKWLPYLRWLSPLIDGLGKRGKVLVAEAQAEAAAAAASK